MYIERHAEVTINKLSQMFGAVLVTGSRQTGKTTLLRKAVPSAEWVSLDDPIILNSARDESSTFLKDHNPPVFIDEIQYAPQLFPQIKMMIDRSSMKGLFYLSGSQQFHMMKNVSESLAGRVGILVLPGISLREKQGVKFYKPFVPKAEYLEERKDSIADIDYEDIWPVIHRGRMPELIANNQFDWQMFYGAYVRTYIERDMRSLAQVGDERKFINFMISAAGRTGNLLNLSEMARDVGISQPTAERWLSVLAASNIIYLLRPYSGNISKRAVKTPKLYFLDTGLAAYLTRWNTPETLKNGAMAGAFFESWVISEIISGYYNAGILEPPLYFYRDSNMKEIDLLIEEDGVLYPVEIKKHADPKSKDINAFNILDKLSGVKRGEGGVVCLYNDLVTLKGNDRVIPVKYL
ncbi:MAG: ATP-binding protein [Synergistaceae bacterium]|nr:ATP-binding protein [Synergistaceae bacterium]MBQ6739211.1 ATP-binding protein [Synergistaceae bacterium]MBQ6910330.1 ATP-binding protein [Synergistaceae bacterium]MBQ9581551.1 ATP-binding protein [Synergistaceae bacterium]MBR0043286.1 ATP-binding protein [Synergistaceae bacterium]